MYAMLCYAMLCYASLVVAYAYERSCKRQRLVTTRSFARQRCLDDSEESLDGGSGSLIGWSRKREREKERKREELWVIGLVANLKSGSVLLC